MEVDTNKKTNMVENNEMMLIINEKGQKWGWEIDLKSTEVQMKAWGKQVWVRMIEQKI